ncbi:MAG: hypothetical protein ACOX8X_00605 [Methanomethylophilus sp.]|jgi:uncharacterized membrane protein
MFRQEIEKCTWCDKPCAGGFCCDECRRKYDDFREKEQQYGKTSLILIFLTAAVCILVGAVYDQLYPCLLIATIVIVAIVEILPMPTDNDVRLVGVRKAVTVIRVIAALILVLVAGLVAYKTI